MNRDVIKDKLTELKAITERLIDVVKNDQHEQVEQLLNKRQDIINDIEKMEYIKEDFRNIAEEISLVNTFKELEIIYQSKKEEVIQKLDSLRNVNTASRSYMNNSSKMKNLFSTKV